jgi:peptidoglycan/xylan/chitin deacetylase (PgdA/CDA1 family)
VVFDASPEGWLDLFPEYVAFFSLTDECTGRRAKAAHSAANRKLRNRESKIPDPAIENRKSQAGKIPRSTVIPFCELRFSANTSSPMSRLTLVFLACLTSIALAKPSAKPTPAPSTPAPAPASAPATPAPAADASTTPAATAPAPVPTSTPKITYSQVHADGPYIAMTFDDGPSAANTPRLLDMLKQRKIHATFFFVGQCVQENPEIVKRIVAEGHEIGNHSWSHPDLARMSEASVQNEIQKTNDAIVAACGQSPKVMRPPYGAFTARQRAWANGTWGFKIILWDVDPLDWKVRNSEHVKAEILKQTVPGSIILSHDIHKTTVDAMPETLDALLAKGFKFVTVSELIAMDHPATPRPKASPAAKADKADKADKSDKADPAKPSGSATPATAAPATPAPAATPAATAKP